MPYIEFPELDNLPELNCSDAYKYIDGLIDWTKADLVDWLKRIRSEVSDYLNEKATIDKAVADENGAHEQADALLAVMATNCKEALAALIAEPPVAPVIPDPPIIE